MAHTSKDLQDLQRLADRGRENRSHARTAPIIRWVGNKITAHVTGSGENVYRTRITLGQKRSYGCDCQDHRKQRGRKGPCKHVILVAREVLTLG